MGYYLPKLSRRYQPTDIHERLINSYALSVYECLWRPHICFIRYCNNPTEITRNHFCGLYLKNHKHLREMFLRRLKDVTEKSSFLRCIWDVLKTPQKIHLFWDVSKRSLRCPSQWRSNWDVSETSHAGWGGVEEVACPSPVAL